MTCSEFKTLIKDYLEGRLSESRKTEFREHLLSCEYCRREMGENIAGIISGGQSAGKREQGNRYVLFFVAFIIFIFLAVISMQYMKLREYRGGEINPLSKDTRERLSGQHKPKPPSVPQQNVSQANEEPTDSGDDNDKGEDFSSYSSTELKARLSDCIDSKDYNCISKAALYLTKMTKGQERKKYRLMAIESLVELSDCASAMLQIMLFFKESPEIPDIHRAHFLNARCYAKEKNYKDAEKILSMIEKDAPELKEEIIKLREEIRKGEKNGKQTEPEGVQDRDSP